MPRPRKTDRPVSVHTYLPASIAARVYALMYSETEGKIPYGALQKFLIRAAEDLLTKLETSNDSHT